MADRLTDMIACVTELTSRLPPRTPEAKTFVCLAKVLALSRGSPMDAAAIAEQGGDARVIEIVKAAQGAGSTTDSDWAQPLAAYQQAAREFIESTRASSVLLQLTGARRVPFRTVLARVDTGALAAWIGEGAPKPLSEMTFGSAAALDAKKGAVIVVITEELARMSKPSAEVLIRSEVTAAVNALIDGTLLSANAATSARPAGLLNGVTAVTSTGSTPADIAADLGTVAAGMRAAGSRLRSPVLLLSPELSLSIGLQTAAGLTFPRTIVSAAVPVEQAILLDESELLLADDGSVAISASNQASLMMDSAPVLGTTEYASLWQHNLVGIRAERTVNWKPAHAAAATAGYVDGIGA